MDLCQILSRDLQFLNDLIKLLILSYLSILHIQIESIKRNVTVNAIKHSYDENFLYNAYNYQIICSKSYNIIDVTIKLVSK